MQVSFNSLYNIYICKFHSIVFIIYIYIYICKFNSMVDIIYICKFQSIVDRLLELLILNCSFHIYYIVARSVVSVYKASVMTYLCKRKAKKGSAISCYLSTVMRYPNFTHLLIAILHTLSSLFFVFLLQR